MTNEQENKSPDQEACEGPSNSSLTWKKNPHPKICTTQCQHDGKGNARGISYVKCFFCSHDFHCTCLGLSEKPEGSWTCEYCRRLPADVSHLKSQVETLLSQNASLIEMVTKQYEMLNGLSSIENHVTAISSKIISENEDDEDDEPEAEPSGTLLIGDSLIHDVVPTDDSLTVDSTGGAYINTIKKKLRAIKQRKYESIVLVIGTNDASTKHTPEKICTDFKALISKAKSVATSVTVSSIPPRDDNRVEAGKLEHLNGLLMPIANEENVKFANHDTNFKYRDNTVDASLLLVDKLHLSAAGVNKLLSNLGLSSKAKAKLGNQQRTQPRNQSPRPVPVGKDIPQLMNMETSPPSNGTTNPVYFHGARSPLSNFFPCPLTINNTHFKSSEHAYQYRKCMHHNNNNKAANVLRAETALEAKRIGDSVQTTTQWEDSMQGTMSEILKLKSRQCPQFYTALMNSNSRPLIEDTPNSYWGRGPEGNGLNMLGRLLTTLRAELQSNSFTPRPTVIPPHNQYGLNAPRSRSEQLRCFNCGEASHTVTSCRLPQPLRCYGCHGTGHKKKFCRKTFSSA